MNYTYLKLSESVTEESPVDAMIEFGEAFGSKIIWGNPDKVSLWYQPEGVNLDDEPGVETSAGGWGYAGFDEKTKIYWRYKDDVLNEETTREHCMRIIIFL